MNYYSKFIPQAAAWLSPLYKLLEKKSTWQWTDECNNVFQECKSLLTSDAVLVHYDIKKQLRLSCDASQYGVGAVLSHTVNGEERPIAFASRTLSKAERNYGHIEKEALALIFGVKRFHKYVYGRQFTMVTDHKPLVPKQQCHQYQQQGCKGGPCFWQHISISLNTNAVKHMQMLTVYPDYQFKEPWSWKTLLQYFKFPL